MPGRVEADPHILLRLVAGERRAVGDRVREACLQVVDQSGPRTLT
jgi:hypothetical protein